MASINFVTNIFKVATKFSQLVVNLRPDIKFRALSNCFGSVMNVSVVCNLVKDVDSYFICPGVEPSTYSDVIQHVIPSLSGISYHFQSILVA